MATRIDYNDVYDPQGNLISSTPVEVEVPEVDPAIAAFAAALTEEQRAALLAALQQ